MNIKASYLFRIRDTIKGIIIFTICVIAALSANFILSLADSMSAFVFGGSYEFAAMLTAFIFGICTIREDLRIGIQNGVDRMSVFISSLLTGVTTAFLFTVIGEIIAIVLDISGISDGPNRMYQLIYLFDTKSSDNLNLLHHIESFVLTFSLLLLANIGGSFLSLMYYRLNKLMKITVSIAVPILMILFLDGTASKLPFMVPIFTFIILIFSIPLYTISMFFVLSAVVAVINWLMIRHAPIKEIK